MTKPRVLTGALVGLMLAAPLLAALYLASQAARLPFVPYDLFDLLTSPPALGPLITVGLDFMIGALTALGVSVADTAKTAEHLLATLLALVLGAGAGAAFFVTLNRVAARDDVKAGWVLGAMVGIPVALLGLFSSNWSASPVFKLIWVLGTFLAWGASMGWVYNRLRMASRSTAEPVSTAADMMTVEQLDRRQFLIRAGSAAAAVTVVGAGLGAVLATSNRRREEARVAAVYPTYEAESIDPDVGLPNADDPVQPVPGTRPELTPIQEHYKVFIRSTPAEVDAATWRLKIDGLVDTPLELSLDELRNNYEPIHRYVTLSCISNRIGGDLIGTTLWTGASFKQVLADAGVQPNAQYVVIESADGFYETIALRAIEADERIMLTYDWDGRPLPNDHGAPLRVYLPDRFGMKQPKWMHTVHVVEDYEEGYWVVRGWSEVAQMRATSVIDVVAVEETFEQNGQRVIPIGGIAHAGARGISRVVVRVDGADWREAQLRAPLSDTTWVIWRYEWPFQAGDHTFEVRCFDGDGTLQITDVNPPHPDGATGIHRIEATV